jgi:acyl-coenzyme A thioesterase PaaI-like protein
LRDDDLVPKVTDEPAPRGGFPQIRAWHGPNLHNPGGGAEYGDMIAALRDLLDAVAAAAPDTATTGHGQTMAPSFAAMWGDHDSVHGTVRFGRYFLGGGGAAHGGAIPLLFDELLGQLANSGERAPSRTAYLHTDYRSITPIGEELAVRAWFVSEQGRKRVLRATITHGETLCAEAEGLFVVLRPDQP